MADTATHAQIRGARAMLDWSMLDLAKAAGVSVATVKRVQDGAEAAGRATTAVQGALEAEGVRFLPDEGEGAGLRLRPVPAV